MNGASACVGGEAPLVYKARLVRFALNPCGLDVFKSQTSQNLL
uniref:Uncharacterized protein n=1 Tax=Zea mays TaxID=4577 RepID=B6U8N8_MAIZE|nr:hypothetical protein [Zea mays]